LPFSSDRLPFLVALASSAPEKLLADSVAKFQQQGAVIQCLGDPFFVEAEVLLKSANLAQKIRLLSLAWLQEGMHPKRAFEALFSEALAIKNTIVSSTHDLSSFL